MKKQIRLSALFIGCLAFTLSGQSDAGVWTSVEVEKRFSQAFSMQLNQELRFNENVTQLGAFFTELGLGYRFNKKFRMAAAYRFVNQREMAEFYSQRHRFYVNAAYRQKIGLIQLTGRLQYQQQYKDAGTLLNFYDPVDYLRTKVSLKLNTERKTEPYISAEVFSPLAATGIQPIDKIRYTFGIDFHVNPRSTIDLFYHIQKEQNRNSIKMDFLSGISFRYRL
jgi:hypothetical protein